MTDPGRRKLRVVQLIDHVSAQGGAERIAMELATRIDRDRFEPVVCASRYDGSSSVPGRAEAAEILASRDVPLIGLGRSGRFDLRSWKPFVDMLRRDAVDVLHTHMFGSNAWGTALSRLAGVPVVVAHEHTWSYVGQPARRFLDRELVARFSSAFVAVSREDRRRMIEVERIDPDDVVLVPNGIELRAPSGRDVRAELGIPAEAPLVGAIAVLRPEKALDVLIRAAARLAPAHPDLRVIIAGVGYERDPLQRLIDELGAAGYVKLIGFRRDVPDLLEAIDVAVSSSLVEGSPLAVMEYMGAGKPIVGTRVGGVPDLIADGREGLVVEPGDADALAAAIGRLIDDRELARRLGDAARERCEREFRIEVTVERFEQLYEKLYAQTDRARAEGFASGVRAAA